MANDYRHSTGVDFEPNEHDADGVTTSQAQHNSSNVGGVTAGHVGHHSSNNNTKTTIVAITANQTDLNDCNVRGKA